MKAYQILSGIKISVVVIFALITSQSVVAQKKEVRASQYAAVTQRIGVTDITVAYHRPKVKGRTVWGELVPYGYNYLGYGSSKAAPWRAGANECTKVTISEDVVVEGKKLSAGVYGLYMAIYENSDVDVIFSNNATMWGSYDYNPDDDALRVKVKSKLAEFTELLTYQFEEVEPNSAILKLNWAKKSIPIKFITTQ